METLPLKPPRGRRAGSEDAISDAPSDRDYVGSPLESHQRYQRLGWEWQPSAVSDGVVAAAKGLSEDQMKFKPAPDRWSVAETLERIVLVEDSLLQNVTDKVMKSPPGAADRDTAKIDAMVLAMIPDRSHKAQAAPPVTPTGRWTPADTLDRFLKTRSKTIAPLESTPDLRAHASDSPLGQQLDAYQWVLFMAAPASVTQNKSSK